MFLPTGMYVLHVPINRYVRPSCSYQQVCTSFMFLPTGMYVLHVPTKRYVRPSCSYQQVCASLMFLPTGIYVLHLPIKRYVRYPASIPFLREQTCKGTYVVISINPPHLIHNCTIETLIWYIMWKISSFSIGKCWILIIPTMFSFSNSVMVVEKQKLSVFKMVNMDS